MTTTMNSINQLTRERLELYRQASNGHRGDADVLRRIQAIDRELKELWERRRHERAGRVEGIDAVIDAAYRSTYGRSYEEAYRPLPVAEAADETVPVAA